MSSKRNTSLMAVTLIALAALTTGCSKSGQATTTTVPGVTTTTVSGTTTTGVIDVGDGGNYVVNLNPADFVSTIDNPFLPMVPGARWVYESKGPDMSEQTKMTVTDQTRVIQGITATVVEDKVTGTDGSLIEETFDWYAQDKSGNVWYLGEDTKEYVNGEVVSTEGTWEAGVDGAQPGIIMKANPQIGDAYRQEYYADHAVDVSLVIRQGASQTVQAGSYQGLLVTHEWTPLEPNLTNEKYYASGVGMVLDLVTDLTGQSEPTRIELISYQPGA
jgi:hypothetical protein